MVNLGDFVIGACDMMGDDDVRIECTVCEGQSDWFETPVGMVELVAWMEAHVEGGCQ